MSSTFVVAENCEETGSTKSVIQNGYKESDINVLEQSKLHREVFNKIQENVYIATTLDLSIHRASHPENGNAKDDMSNNILSRKEQNHPHGESESILKFRRLSGKRKLLVVVCLFTYFLNGVAYAILAPFFPAVAAEKGMSLTMNGFVFSVYMLVSFLTVPIFGSNMTTLGPKFAFVSGIFVAGVSTVLQGTVYMCPSGTPFTVITLLCRISGALGFSVYLTALMAIIVNEFPKDVSTVYAILETAGGIGLMVGPSIGGLLFELGGFGLPFYVTGITILLCGPPVYAIAPNSNIPEKKKTSRWRLLKSPLVVIGMTSTVIGAIGISYLAPTLANHLKSFDLSVSVIGLFFVLAPCLYATLSPVWGYITDQLGVYKQVMSVGQFIFGLSFFFIGPCSFLSFLPFEIWTIVLGLVIAGASMGSCLVPPMKCMVDGSKDVGFDENIDTFAMLSGLVFSMFFLGAFIGPMASGFLVKEYGSANAFTAIGILNILMSVVEFIFFSLDYLLTSRRRHKHSNVSDGYITPDKGQSEAVNESAPLLDLKNDNVGNK